MILWFTWSRKKEVDLPGIASWFSCKIFLQINQVSISFFLKKFYLCRPSLPDRIVVVHQILALIALVRIQVG